MTRVLVVIALAVSTASPTGWSVVAVPSPTGAKSSDLAAVSCSVPTACTAVGAFFNRAGTLSTLAARWNGAAFSIQPTHDPGMLSLLNGVSCPAPDACTAVGQFSTAANNGFTLAERWDGSAWSIQPTPNPPAAGASLLAAVNCPVAGECIAVGSSQNQDQHIALAERWDGTAWSIQPVPNPAGAFNSFLKSVTCPAINACVAAGYYDRNGENVPLIERWNGSTWSQQSVPSPNVEGGRLFGVSCSAANACTAVGSHLDAAGAQDFTLAERWDGSAWSIQPSANPTGAPDAFLVGVSCTNATTCRAVGDFLKGVNTDATLAEQWDGKAWSVQSTPNPGPIANQLSAVACPSVTVCLAVGTAFRGQGKSSALAERFTG